MLLVRMLTRSIFEIKTKEPVETDGLFPYLLPLTSYLLLNLIPHTLHFERCPDEWAHTLGIVVSDRLREIVCV